MPAQLSYELAVHAPRRRHRPRDFWGSLRDDTPQDAKTMVDAIQVIRAHVRRRVVRSLLHVRKRLLSDGPSRPSSARAHVATARPTRLASDRLLHTPHSWRRRATLRAHPSVQEQLRLWCALMGAPDAMSFQQYRFISLRAYKALLDAPWDLEDATAVVEAEWSREPTSRSQAGPDVLRRAAWMESVFGLAEEWCAPRAAVPACALRALRHPSLSSRRPAAWAPAQPSALVTSRFNSRCSLAGRETTSRRSMQPSLGCCGARSICRRPCRSIGSSSPRWSSVRTTSMWGYSRDAPPRHSSRRSGVLRRHMQGRSGWRRSWQHAWRQRRLRCGGNGRLASQSVRLNIHSWWGVIIL
jgi:hypothetical protein